MVIEENQTGPEKEQTMEKEFPSRIRYLRFAFFLLAWIFALCIVIQVFIAGMAIFDDPENWRKHTSFVHLFEFVPIVMFILGFPARLSKVMIWGSLGLYALIFAQYATANLGSALHPVIALILFWGSFAIARRSFRIVFGRLNS